MAPAQPEPLMILVAGPYRSGTGDDPDLIAANHRVLQEACLQLFRAGHLAVNGEDLDRVVAVHGPRAAHVQVADVPGRGAPGTGELDLPRHLRRLEDAGYAGWVALEHLPGDGDPFAWLPREARAAG